MPDEVEIPAPVMKTIFLLVWMALATSASVVDLCSSDSPETTSAGCSRVMCKGSPDVELHKKVIDILLLDIPPGPNPPSSLDATAVAGITSAAGDLNKSPIS